MPSRVDGVRCAVVAALDLIFFSTVLGPFDHLQRPNTPPLILITIAGLLVIPLLYRHRNGHMVFWTMLIVSLVVSLTTTYRPVVCVLVAVHAAAELRGSRRFTASASLAIVPLIAAWHHNDQLSSRTTTGPDPISLTIVTVGAYLLLIVVAFAVGRLHLVHRLQVMTLERSHRAAELDATNAERQRVGRELHDIVSNAIAVMTLTAGAASRSAVSSDTAHHLNLIEDTGVRAGEELHRLLRTMRAPNDHEVATMKSPTFTGEGLTLINDMKRAGLRLTFSETGSKRSVDTSVDATLYRTAQEGLTNTLKHGDLHQPVTLTINWKADTVQIEIFNTSNRQPRRRIAGGHGISGLRERVTIVGGSLTIERTAETFRLTVSFPTTKSRSTPPAIRTPAAPQRV